MTQTKSVPRKLSERAKTAQTQSGQGKYSAKRY